VICVLGDAHLDVVVRPAGPIAHDTDTPAATLLSAGGQAANTAAWICALGGRARLIAARAPDLAGQLVAAELGRRGVDLKGPVLGGRTGTVVSVSPDGSTRSMLTDRGVGPLLAAGHLEPGWLDGCGWLHLPAYSLVAEPVAGAALAAVAAIPRLSVDLSSVAVLTDYGPGRFRALLGRLAPAVVFGNEAEAALIAGPDGAGLPGTDLVVKLGPAGVRAGGRVHPAAPADPVDPTGAGDAFAAGYLLGGVTLGLEAAARAVAVLGAMP
jgi:sugar/nucleoside kinase (ribokinase family)